MADPRPLTREELAKFLPNQRAIRAFEQLFDSIPADLITLTNQVQEVSVDAGNANAKAVVALSQLERIANAMELIALRPPLQPEPEIEFFEPPSQPETIFNDLSLPLATPQEVAACGEFYATNISVTIAVALANTAYEVTSGMTGGYLNLATFGGSHYIQVERNGVYHINWSMSIDTAAAADEIEGGFMVDGTAQNNATSHSTVSAASEADSIAANGFVTLSAGNQISLFVRNHTAARDITVEHASLTIRQVS